MADQVPQSRINRDFLKVLKILVKRDEEKSAKIEEQGAMIAELQGDRTATIEGLAKVTEVVTDLQSHKEVVSGENGVVSQLGDLSENAEIHAELLAVVPELAEPDPSAGASADISTEASPAPAETMNIAEPQAAAA